MIVYHPEEDKIQKTISELNVSQNVITALESGNEEFLKYKMSGVSQYGYIAPVGTTGYFVVSSFSSMEYYMQLIITIVFLVLVFIVGMVLIVLGMRKTATKITKPILELNKTAQQLAAGNLDVDLQITTEDEIGELGNSISETVSRLKEYIAYIDEISDVLSGMADGKLVVELKNDYVGEFQKVKACIAEYFHIYE